MLILCLLVQPALLRLNVRCEAVRTVPVSTPSPHTACCPCCEDGACCGMIADQACTSKPAEQPARPASEGEAAKSLAVLTAVLPTSWSPLPEALFNIARGAPARATMSSHRSTQSLLCVWTT
jgi:hypothetical protein